MSATLFDQAQSAWQQALGQLRYTLNRADFETWVQDARPLAYDGQVLTVGVANAYARDWLTQRLRTPLENQLRGILNAPAQVVFVVTSPASNAAFQAPPSLSSASGTIVPQKIASPQNVDTTPTLPAVSSAPSPPEEPAVDLQEVSLRLRDAFQQPQRVVFLPGYFLRWLPYLGTRAAWLYVALRQALFLSGHFSHGANQSIHPGQAVEATRQTLAHWSHLTKRTINNILNHGLLSPLVQVERDRHLDAHRQAPNRYIFTADMPLTPADVEATLAFLHLHGLSKDPIGALSAALQQPHHSLLAPPPPRPPARWQRNTLPSLRTEVAATLHAQRFPSSTLAKALGMAELLEASLIEGEGKLFIPWYFIHHHLPRLGHTTAWLYLTVLHHAHRRGRPAGNGFRHIETTSRQIAAWLGLKKTRYGRALVPVIAASPKEDSQKETALFLYRQPGRGNTFTLAVQTLLPLTPTDEQAYHLALEVLAACIQEENITPLKQLQKIRREHGNNAAAAYLRDRLRITNEESHLPGEVWLRATEALGQISAHLPEFSSGSSTATANERQKFPPETPTTSSDNATTFPLMSHKIPSAKAKNFPHFNSKTPSLQKTFNNPSTSSQEVGGKTLPWMWEDLLPHLHIAPKLQPVLKQRPAWLGIAWLLYVAVHYRRFSNPLGFALHKIQTGESPGGVFDTLAQWPKETFRQDLARCLQHGPESMTAIAPEWSVFQQMPHEAREQLKDWLGIDFV